MAEQRNRRLNIKIRLWEKNQGLSGLEKVSEGIVGRSMNVSVI